MMEDQAPEGYRYEWVPDESWTVGGHGRKCRMKGCENMAVAALARRHRERSGFVGFRRWPYCADHLYGRKIEDGVVKARRMVEIEP